MGITRIHLKNFTAFDDLDMQVSPGLNVLIGENGTGKTHLMKVAYAACEITISKKLFHDKLEKTFLPSGGVGRLVKRRQGGATCHIEIQRENLKFTDTFSSREGSSSVERGLIGRKEWRNTPVESVFIPAKEILSNSPGFISSWERRELHFEEIYPDILKRAQLKPLRGQPDLTRKRLLSELRKILDGTVVIKGEEFFLSNRQGHLEFTLLAEGIRKLGLLWQLVQNGTLSNGSVLFWDEPEANLNPKLYGAVIDILLYLQRMGVQIFIATHDYVILKEMDLQMKPSDVAVFHSLYKDPQTREVKCHSTSDYLQIEPNAIAATFGELFDREINRQRERSR